MKTIKFAVAGFSIAAVILSAVRLIQGDNEPLFVLLACINSIFATWLVGSGLNETH